MYIALAPGCCTEREDKLLNGEIVTERVTQIEREGVIYDPVKSHLPKKLQPLSAVCSTCFVQRSPLSETRILFSQEWKSIYTRGVYSQSLLKVEV